MNGSVKELKGIKHFQLQSAPSSRSLFSSARWVTQGSQNGLLSWCVGPTLTLLHVRWGLLDASQGLLQPSVTAAVCFISAQLLGHALLQVTVFSAYTEVTVWVVCLFERPVNPTVASGRMTSGVNGTWHKCWGEVRLSGPCSHDAWVPGHSFQYCSLLLLHWGSRVSQVSPKFNGTIFSTDDRHAKFHSFVPCRRLHFKRVSIPETPGQASTADSQSE